MSGGRAAKQKGNRVERECVNLAKVLALNHAERGVQMEDL